MKKSILFLVGLLFITIGMAQNYSPVQINPFFSQFKALRALNYGNVLSPDTVLVKGANGWIAGYPISNLIRANTTYSNPDWIATLDYNKLTGAPTLSAVALTGSYSDLTDKPVLFSGSYTDLTNKPTVFPSNIANVSGLQSALDGKQPVGSYLTTEVDPTVPGYVKSITSGQISTWNNPTYAALPDKPTIVTYISGTGISISAGVITNTAPNQTVSISSGSGINVTGTYPNFTVASVSVPRVFNNNVARSLNSNFTVSTTRDAIVTYTVSMSVTNPLLAGNSTVNVFLEYSTDGGTNWITVCDPSNLSSVGLAVAVAITNTQKGIVSGVVPANSLVRIRTTVSGTASALFSRAQEVLL